MRNCLPVPFDVLLTSACARTNERDHTLATVNQHNFYGMRSKADRSVRARNKARTHTLTHYTLTRLMVHQDTELDAPPDRTNELATKCGLGTYAPEETTCSG